MQTTKTINYLPLGDSYTICTGASEKESWPRVLTNHLVENKIKCSLLDNPARNGYTTQNLIDRELPLLKQNRVDFVTLLIGVNDWVQGVSRETFHKNLIYILDEIQLNIRNKQNILLITIPDFGKTPQGKRYANGRDISLGIYEFNEVIKREAKKRNLILIDVFEVSQKMGDDKLLVASDGLHPSAKEYANWESIILPEAIKLLK